MDVIGLTLGILFVVAANIAYVLVFRFRLARLAKLRLWLLSPSYVVVVLAFVEILLVLTVGPVVLRTVLGPTFEKLHLLVLFFSAPSLANVLLLMRRGNWSRDWPVTMALCCWFGIFLLFFQVSVGNALYGIDGAGGPFSRWLVSDSPRA